MERYDIRDVDALVAAQFAVNEAAARLFYGNTERQDECSYCCGTMRRLMMVSDATQQGVFTGERNADGTPFTKYLTYKGCRFWAPANTMI